MSTPYVFRGNSYTLVHCLPRPGGVGRGRYAVYLTGLSWGYRFQGGFRAARVKYGRTCPRCFG